MIAKPLLLPQKLMIAMSGLSIAMTIGLFYSKINGVPVEIKWAYIALILAFVPFIVVVIDLVRNPIRNKILWAIILCSTSILCSFLYLVMREKTLINSNLKNPKH